MPRKSNHFPSLKGVLRHSIEWEGGFKGHGLQRSVLQMTKRYYNGGCHILLNPIGSPSRGTALKRAVELLLLLGHRSEKSDIKCFMGPFGNTTREKKKRLCGLINEFQLSVPG